MEKKKNPEILGLRHALLIGILFYPVFYLLDLIIYPDFKYDLLIIRIVVTGIFIILYYLTRIIHVEHIFLLMLISFFIPSFGISLMCFVTGEGFSSPYYAGIFLVIILASLFFRIELKYFIILLFSIIIQHFLLLSFVPFGLKDIMKNVFFLGSFTIISILIHSTIYKLVKENSLLKDFLPICAKCKKIRDDKGYWHQIELYIRNRTDTEFSHGLCPECLKEMYDINKESD